MTSEEILREKIINALGEQGFKINPHVSPWDSSKEAYKVVQQRSRREQISHHKEFLKGCFEQAKMYCRDGRDIVPEEIKLELREVKSNSFEEILFRWWNLIWWSIPYQHAYGRQMRFLLWDNVHDAPFGLIGLQSPVLKISVRDNALEIPKGELDIWVNKSMNAQRVGALPPYNELLGGKMVALTLASNEIRDTYKRKYNSDLVAKCLGYTQGSGSFQIPENLYDEIVQLLKSRGVNIARGYGNGPSRKLRLIALGLRYLGIPSFAYHGIKREFYLFPLVKNLKKVIQNEEDAIWYDRPFDKLVDYWKERWAIPRAERMPEWKDFEANKFFKKVNKVLKEFEGDRNGSGKNPN